MRAFVPYHLQHHKGPDTRGRVRSSRGYLARGVVLNTYLPSDPTSPETLINPGSALGITCRVLIIDPRNTTVLKNVPVMVQSAGLNDHEIWKPRPTSADLATGVVTISPEGVPTQVSSGSDLDGDHVVVGCLNDDLQQPVILGQLPHPSTNRKPNYADLTKYKYRRWLRGASYGITEDGNVEIDLSAASDGTITSPGLGTEVPNTPIGGNVDLTMQTGTALTIKDAVLSAPKKALLGEAYLTDYSSFLTSEATFLTSEATFITGLATFITALTSAVDSVVSAAATTFSPIVATYAGAITTFQSAQSTLSSNVSTSLSANLPYLSSHLELD